MNQEGIINLSILTMSGPGKFTCVDSNQATAYTPGSPGVALLSVTLNLTLATTLHPDLNTSEFSEGAGGVV